MHPRLAWESDVAMDISVLSYNCRGLRLGQSAEDKARRIVVDQLLEHCDILCLQETFWMNKMAFIRSFLINEQFTNVFLVGDFNADSGSVFAKTII